MKVTIFISRAKIIFSVLYLLAPGQRYIHGVAILIHLYSRPVGLTTGQTSVSSNSQWQISFFISKIYDGTYSILLLLSSLVSFENGLVRKFVKLIVGIGRSQHLIQRTNVN